MKDEFEFNDTSVCIVFARLARIFKKTDQLNSEETKLYNRDLSRLLILGKVMGKIADGMVREKPDNMSAFHFLVKNSDAIAEQCGEIDFEAMEAELIDSSNCNCPGLALFCLGISRVARENLKKQHYGKRWW